MDALLNAPRHLRERLTPLIEVATMKGEAADITPHSPLWRIGDLLQRSVGVDEPFFLDFHAHIARSVVMRVVQDCLMHGLTFVPVIRPERAAQGRALVQAAGQDSGVALRISVSPFTPTGMGIDDLIQDLLEQTEVEQTDADLFLDLGQLQGVLTAEDVRSVIAEVTGIRKWRNFAISGTTMPSAFGQDQFKLDAATLLPRREWQLYTELRRLALDRVPTFSDYGIQGAGRPNKGFRPIPNLRYTADSHTVVLRGNRRASNISQHAELCGALAQRPEFKGPAFSRGDALIKECASGTRELRDQEMMRSIGTSHHFELVAKALADDAA